jgi:hypothetical protein
MHLCINNLLSDRLKRTIVVVAQKGPTAEHEAMVR